MFVTNRQSFHRIKVSIGSDPIQNVIFNIFSLEARHICFENAIDIFYLNESIQYILFSIYHCISYGCTQMELTTIKYDCIIIHLCLTSILT